ncbi:hypothetical protein [Mesorhizobium sp. LSHC420B00]|uniref:hypothetical protein n=2 Tax=unclassified Mesorhizobium TaxID=325217 RepID=UPI001FD87D7A|nr:hypothetical protein [Mesorhizobium sp. LSHC420B00]
MVLPVPAPVSFSFDLFPFCSILLGWAGMALRGAMNMNELPAFRITENGQAVFNWQELDRRWNDRLFFAILLESTIAVPLARRAAVWRRESGLRGQVFPAERLHISLIGLGDYDGLPEELVKIARHVASMVQANRLRCRSIGCRLSAAVRWCCVAATASRRCKRSGAILPP